MRPASTGTDVRATMRAIPRVALAVAVTLATIGAGVAALGPRPPATFFAVVGFGALCAQLVPHRRRLIALGTGMLALALLNPVFSVYFIALVAALAGTRRRALPFAAILIAGAVVLPKLAFGRLYHQPGYWNWVNEPSLALALFASALWWRAPADGGGRGLDSFLLLYFMPSHAAYPMAFSPKAIASHEDRAAIPGSDLPLVTPLLGWFAVKVAALAALRALAPHGFLRTVAPEDVVRWGRGELWGVVGRSYVEHYLGLAASADVPVLIARLYGWSLPDPFRAALLAWSPVELWRRWGLYNRSLLLQLVYFPLGGGQTHRTRNVMLTFLASALFLHSGWFGSKYWTVGTGGWRDQALYFLLQGLAVCVCLKLGGGHANRAPTASSGPCALAGRVAGIVATQAWSALVHVVVLAQGIDLATRLRLVLRCLGL